MKKIQVLVGHSESAMSLIVTSVHCFFKNRLLNQKLLFIEGSSESLGLVVNFGVSIGYILL